MTEFLFSAGPDWQNNACLNYGLDNWPVYAMGYREGGKALVDRLLDDRRHLDSLIYPVIFLYRQYLELTLKYLLREANQYLGEEAQIRPIHRVSLLWDELQPKMTLVYQRAELSPIDVREAAAIISEFARIDDSSMAFRYPDDRQGQNLLPDIMHINVRQFAEAMERLSTTLDDLVLVFDYLAHLREQEALFLGDRI